MSDFRALVFALLVSVIGLSSCGKSAEQSTETNSDSLGVTDPIYDEEEEEDAEPLNARVIAKSGLTIRKEPSLKGEKIAAAPFLSELQVISTELGELTVEGLQSQWMEVIWSGKKGYAFAGFLDIPLLEQFCWCDAADTQVEYEGYEGEITKGFAIETQAKIACFLKLPDFRETGDMLGVSASGRWLAIDEGTDIVGGLTIFDLLKNKTAMTKMYDRNASNWEGNRITFNEVTEEEAKAPAGNDYPYWVKTIEWQFNDGRLSKTGKTGVTETH